MRDKTFARFLLFQLPDRRLSVFVIFSHAAAESKAGFRSRPPPVRNLSVGRAKPREQRGGRGKHKTKSMTGIWRLKNRQVSIQWVANVGFRVKLGRATLACSGMAARRRVN